METIIVVERRYLNNINIYDELSNLILNFITEYLSNKYHEVYHEFEDVSCNVYEGGLNED